MGGNSSKLGSEISPGNMEIVKECGEDANAELRRTKERMKEMKDEYQRNRTMFGLRENPEAVALRDAFGQRLVLGNLGGACGLYLLARYMTSYDTFLKRTYIRAGALFVGGFLGLSWAISTGLSPFATGQLEKSNWAPRLICPALSKYKPCVEDKHGCRQVLRSGAGSTMGMGRQIIDAYEICQQKQEAGLTLDTMEEGGKEDGREGVPEASLIVEEDNR